MFKSIGATMVTGIAAIVPLLLTAYILYWLAVSSEEVMGGALKWVLPSAHYFPGLGILFGLGMVFIIGLLMRALFIQQIFHFSERILQQLPVIKAVYSAFRDLWDFFSPKKGGLGSVVMVSLGDIKVIGFVTQQDPSSLPRAIQLDGGVLVYIPMSYMIGGFTVLVRHEAITACDMDMEEAMRFVLTAGITSRQRG